MGEHEKKTAKTQWVYLEITTEKPEQKRVVMAPQNAAAGQRKKLSGNSVIDCEPLSLESESEPVQKELKMPNNPGKRNTTFAPTVKADGPSKSAPVMKAVRTSTYTRPVSIFGEFKVNSTFDIVFDKEKNNVYSMPDANRPKYEQEGRWEFRATEVAPPPPFRGVEKTYATGQPSFIDFEAKERSAVFD